MKTPEMDPILLEVLRAQMQGVVEEMGETGLAFFHLVSRAHGHHDLEGHDILGIGRYNDDSHPVVEHARLSAGRE